MAPNLPPLWADEVYFEEIIRNLLVNADKYTPPTCPIDLTILADEDGGNWTYFAFDANKLSPAQARQTALRIAADIRKGRT